MKTDIHPTLHPVVFVDSSNGTEFITTSTLTSDKKKKIKGVEHFVISVDISSASHPFYTGKQMLIDTAGRIDKFRARMEASKKLQEQHLASKKKREENLKESLEEKITRKAQENTTAKEEAKAKEIAKKENVKSKSKTKSKSKSKKEVVQVEENISDTTEEAPAVEEKTIKEK